MSLWYIVCQKSFTWNMYVNNLAHCIWYVNYLLHSIGFVNNLFDAFGILSK